MKDKVNGKTPEEIKKGLECCINWGTGCTECQYNNLPPDECVAVMKSDNLEYIQHLEAERDQYKRERDAAVADIKQIAQDPFGVSCCDFCKFCDNEEECEKRNCSGNRVDFEWRGAEVEG